MMLPVVLFFLNLPNKGFGTAYLKASLAGTELADTGGPTVEKEGFILRFDELDLARTRRASRELFEGQTARLKGKFNPISDKQFTLYRLNMKCCGADAVPLKVQIIAPEPVLFSPGDWITVEGRIHFQKLPDKDEYVPVIRLDEIEQVRPALPDNNEYEI